MCYNKVGVLALPSSPRSGQPRGTRNSNFRPHLKIRIAKEGSDNADSLAQLFLRPPFSRQRGKEREGERSTYIPTDDDVQQYQLRQPNPPSLVYPVVLMTITPSVPASPKALSPRRLPAPAHLALWVQIDNLASGRAISIPGCAGRRFVLEVLSGEVGIL